MLVLVLFSIRSCTTLGLVRKETVQLNVGCSRGVGRQTLLHVTFRTCQGLSWNVLVM